MQQLTMIEGTELSEYVIQLLLGQGIKTIREFLDLDFVKLSRITNVKEESIVHIKKKIRQKYGPKPVRMLKYYNEVKKKLVNYRTGINPLDTMLADDDFSSGRLIEIIGIPGIGKTILSTTIAVNFAFTYKTDVLYVDTKIDFSGSRVHKILSSGNYPEADVEKTMLRIKVERAFSAEDVIKILEELLVHVSRGNGAGANIKLVIIDSLPAVWYLLIGEEFSLQGKHLLNKLANLARKLASDHHLVFLFVNIFVSAEDFFEDNQLDKQANNNDDADNHGALNNETEIIEPALKPSLGKYWEGVPTLRLAVEETENIAGSYTAINNYVNIRVMKSCYSVTGVHCTVEITDAGTV